MFTVRKEQGAHHGYSQFRTALELLEAAGEPVEPAAPAAPAAPATASPASIALAATNAPPMALKNEMEGGVGTDASASAPTPPLTRQQLELRLKVVQMFDADSTANTNGMAALLTAVEALQHTVATQASQLRAVPKLREEVAALRAELRAKDEL